MSHGTPGVFHKLFHPHRVLSFTRAPMSPTLCRVLPRDLNLVTCGSRADGVLTLPNRPTIHSDTISCNLSFLLTLSFLSSPRLPSNAAVPPPVHISPLRTAPHHPRTFSCQRASFLMFSVSESIVTVTSQGPEADPRWRPVSTANGYLIYEYEHI